MAKILVVDDNVDMLDTLEQLLGFYKHDVLRAENGRIGIDIAQSQHPELIILDALMPVLNGFETCEILKSDVNTRDIPIIFLSANYTEDVYKLKSYQLGADTYILKPFNTKDLIAKINALLHRKELINQLREENYTLLRISSFKTLGNVSDDHYIDHLTVTFSDLCLKDYLQGKLPEFPAFDGNYAISIIDADHFKLVNENFGDLSGDYALIRIANIILKYNSPVDFVFRSGSNKFTLISHGTNCNAAYELAENIRKQVSSCSFFDSSFYLFRRQNARRKNEIQNLSVSIGISAAENAASPHDVLKNAEMALQEAKNKGRNRTIQL
jgi:diguanylate cyclase (GGDEF)-like protein